MIINPYLKLHGDGEKITNEEIVTVTFTKCHGADRSIDASAADLPVWFSCLR